MFKGGLKNPYTQWCRIANPPQLKTGQQ